MREFMTCLEDTFFPVHVIRMELNLRCFPNETFHTSEFLGQNIGVIKVDAVTYIYPVLSHDLFL